MKKQIEVKVEIVSDKSILSYHLLEISKYINETQMLCGLVEIISAKVNVKGLFVNVEYDDENYLERRFIQRFNTLKFLYYQNEILYNNFQFIDDEYVKITQPYSWFKTINSSGMLSEYYVVDYENKKYLFSDHLCGNREIFDIENDKVYKDFLNRKIPCDFKTDIYKKYLKGRDMTNSEWTVKEFKNNKMNYNFTTRIIKI